MPLAIQITDGTTTVNLSGSTNHGIRSMSLGVPQRDTIFSGARHSSYDHVADFTFRNREAVQIAARIIGTSLDNWVTQYRNAQNLITESKRYWHSRGVYGARAYLDVQLNGMTNSTRYDILDGEVDAGPGVFTVPMTVTTAPKTPNALLTLSLKPWGRAPSSTSGTSAALINEGEIYTVTAPAGDWDSPCKVTLQPGATMDMRRIILWRRSRGIVADFLRRVEAETGTFTNVQGGASDYTVTSLAADPGWTVANEADVAASDGNRVDLVRNTGAGAEVGGTLYPILRWALGASSPLLAQYGTFQIYARLRAPTLPGVENLQLRFGGAGSDRQLTKVSTTNKLSTTDWRLLDLGALTIPERSLTSAATGALFNFELWGDFEGAGSTVNYEIDCLYFVPLDQDILDVTLSANSGNNDKLVSDALDVQPALYLTDSANVPQPEYFTGTILHTFFSVQRGVNNIFGYLLMDDANNKHVLADTATITVEFYPLYALFR